MARSLRWRQIGQMLYRLLFVGAAAQAAEQIFGMLQDSKVQITETEAQVVYSSCFSGLGLFRCKAKRDAGVGYLLSDIEVRTGGLPPNCVKELLTQRASGVQQHRQQLWRRALVFGVLLAQPWYRCGHVETHL